jgi:uncharacterized protein YdhG (YjbR/CyaY superfamily)
MQKPTNIDSYIAQCAPEVQEQLQQLRHIIQKAAPEATERISYGMPTFYLYGNLVHFAAWKAHIGLYPAPAAIGVFSKELATYFVSKGSVHLPLDQPLPKRLIEQIVHFRMAENRQKKALNKAK